MAEVKITQGRSIPVHVTAGETIPVQIGDSFNVKITPPKIPEIGIQPIPIN